MPKILAKLLAMGAISFVIIGGLSLGLAAPTYVNIDFSYALSKAPDIILTILAGLFPLILLIVPRKLTLTATAGLLAVSSLVYAVLAGLVAATGAVSEVVPDIGSFLAVMAVDTGVFSVCLANERINAYFARHTRQ